MYQGRPTRPKKLKPIDTTRYMRAAPHSLADAASQLGVRPVHLAQAIREGKVATVRGRGGELLIAHEELERVRRERLGREGLPTLALWKISDCWRAQWARPVAMIKGSGLERHVHGVADRLGVPVTASTRVEGLAMEFGQDRTRPMRPLHRHER